MTIHLYTPYWSSFGGGEKYLIGVARALTQFAHTEVVLLCDSTIGRKPLETFYGVDLSSVHLRHISGSVAQAAREADVFVCLSNFRRVATTARTCVQLLQIPYARITPTTMLAKFMRGEIREVVKDLYRLRLLAFARDGADAVVTNSRFVHDVLFDQFGIHSEILHPPIDDFRREGFSKKNIILSAGRFFAGLYNEKRYDILTRAFRILCKHLEGWEYHICGSAAKDPQTTRMIESLKSENREYPVVFHVNAPLDELRRLYNEASLFWHGAGYGVDETKHPENVEHFGMTTVEAMSAGCIPVVINKGGQRDIVQHGLHGFLWNSIDELVDTTLRLTRESADVLRELRNNARKRYYDFSLSQFDKRVHEIFSPIISQST